MALLATCLATLLATALLLPFSCAGQSVCTVTDTERVPLCDGDVMQVYPNVTDERTPLYFAFMQSFSGGYISSGGIAGVMVALDEINDESRSSILPGYGLHYTLSDNACVRALSQRTLFKQLREERVKVAAIGSGCTLATEPSGEISHFFSIPQISCHSSSPSLRNRQRFPNYFQTIGSEENQGLADFGVIKYYGWKRITVLQLDVDSFEKVTIELRDQLRKINVDVTVKTFEEDEGIEGLGDDPFGEDRVFAFIMYEGFARDLLCKAHERNLRYPRFTFMHAAWWAPRWWALEDANCTVEEREAVVEYSIAVLLYEYIENLNDVAQTGIDGHTFMRKFQEHHDNFKLGNLTLPAENPLGQSCYDATWILSLALNRTIANLTITDPGFDITILSYENGSNYLETLSYYLSQTNFHGISGNITFDHQGIRAGARLFVYQNRYRNGNLTQGKQTEPIARISFDNGIFTFQYTENNTNSTVWPLGVVHDGAPVEEIVTVHLSITVIFVLLAFIGIVFTIACLVYNFIFRNQKLIRLTSPNLNYIIGAGAILLYLDICVIVAPSTDRDVVKVLCHITLWLTSLGYSLCFGTIIGKMIRVFYIFSNPTLNKKLKIQDYHIMLFVLGLVVVDVVILVTGILLDQLMTDNEDPEKKPNAEKESEISGVREIETHFFIYICSSQVYRIILGVLYGYKSLIQVATVIMALKTRKVKVKGLDDYREIILATYFSSFLLIIVLIFTYTIDDHINTYAFLTGTNFFVGTTLIVALVFVPKMIALYKDPLGKEVFSKTTPTDNYNDDYVSSQQAPTEDIENLRHKIQELEHRLSKVDDGTLEKKSPSSPRVTFCDVSPSQQPPTKQPSAGNFQTNGASNVPIVEDSPL